jgi:hypothetical protein
MNQRVSTELEADLVRRARLESIRQGKPLDQILGEALELYLDEKGVSRKQSGVVSGSWGALNVNREVLEDLLDEDNGLFDA